MCICWCVTEINYKMHGATIKIIFTCSNPTSHEKHIVHITKINPMKLFKNIITGLSKYHRRNKNILCGKLEDFLKRKRRWYL